MPTEQYVQHDWSPWLWSIGLSVMVTFVFVAMGVFLLMVHRACQTTAAQPERRTPETRELREPKPTPAAVA